MIGGGNDLNFNQSGVLAGAVTGVQVQAGTAAFAGNGYQGVNGSAYTFDGDFSIDGGGGVIGVPFTGSVVVVLASPVPEPASLAILGAGLLGIAVIRRHQP